MGHYLKLPPEQRACYPDNNASCVQIQHDFGTRIVLYMVIVFVMLVTILGNSLVIVSVCHFKQLQNPTNVLILSLALADLQVGVIVMPFSATRTIYGCLYYSDTFCHIHISYELFLTTFSIFNLICIAIDRYQAICNPLHYSRKITMPVAMIMVFASWTLAAVYSYGVLHSKSNVAGIEELIKRKNCLGGCFAYFNPLWGILSSVFCFFFPCTVMVCFYTQIFIVAKEHVRKIRDKNNSSNDRGRGGIVKKSEHKAAKTLGIVLGAFIFCWMPFFMNLIFDPLTGFRIPVPLLEVLYWLGYFNSALNPLIYALFYPCFKKCFQCIISLQIFNSNSSNLNLSVK